jgi:hypothetical protein
MSFPPEWPADPRVAEFDALQEDPARWIEVVSALGARYSTAPAVPAGEGTVLVALLGCELVIKLYPPFLRDHFAFERAMLAYLHGRLSLPTPRLVDSAEHAGWPFLVMTRLTGTPLDCVWPSLRQAERCAVLRSALTPSSTATTAAPSTAASANPCCACCCCTVTATSRPRSPCLAGRRRRTSPPWRL